MTGRQRTQVRPFSQIADMPEGEHRDHLAALLFPPRMRSHPDIYPLIDELVRAEHLRRAYVARNRDTPIAQAARRRAMQTQHAHERRAA